MLSAKWYGVDEGQRQCHVDLWFSAPQKLCYPQHLRTCNIYVGIRVLVFFSGSTKPEGLKPVMWKQKLEVEAPEAAIFYRSGSGSGSGKHEMNGSGSGS